MDDHFLLYEIKDRIGTLTLNRPDKLNSLDQVLWKNIRQTLKDGDDNGDIDVQIITGTGRAFCAGDDISVLTQMQDPEICKDLMLDCIYGLTDTIIHLQKPLIAAVNGYAYGGGIGVFAQGLLGGGADRSSSRCDPRRRLFESRCGKRGY